MVRRDGFTFREGKANHLSGPDQLLQRNPVERDPRGKEMRRGVKVGAEVRIQERLCRGPPMRREVRVASASGREMVRVRGHPLNDGHREVDQRALFLVRETHGACSTPRGAVARW